MRKKTTGNTTGGTIQVAGKALPCRVTMGAMIRFKRASGYDVSRLDTGDMEGLTLFLWCCVAAACSADKIEFDLPFEEFADLLEPADLNGFYGSMPSAPEGEKKMATPVTLST